ncbi:MAG TPA: PQQ-binding-like beta-propeller repeat protein, partial [Chitinophagaceae bacterium]
MNSKFWGSATVLLLSALSSCHPGTADKYREWNVYGGSKEAIHYSSLTQVDTANVRQLKPVWTYHSGDMDHGSQIQVNPVMANGILYGVSPKLKLFAVDAATGAQHWVFDPAKKGPLAINACRGVTLYNGGNDDLRVFYTAGSSLWCINAVNGQPIDSFGNKGKIDLHNDLGRDVKDLYVTSTTPGIIYKDLLIVGTRVAEEAAAAPGYIRAYDVHNGQLRWVFHTIPDPGEKGYESWDDKEAYNNVGGANAWAGFSLDEEKGIVFAPIGSAVYDFYGGKRKGDDLY